MCGFFCCLLPFPAIWDALLFPSCQANPGICSLSDVFFFFFSLFWDPAFSAGTWGILFHLTHNKGFLSLSFLILTFGLLTALFSLLSHVLHECPHCLSPNQPLQDGWRAFLQLSVIKPHAVSGTLLILFCITYQEARWEDPVTAEDDHAGRTIFSSCTSRCKLTDESL